MLNMGICQKLEVKYQVTAFEIFCYMYVNKSRVLLFLHTRAVRKLLIHLFLLPWEKR